MDVLAQYDGAMTDGFSGDSMVVRAPAKHDTGFQAHIRTKGLSIHRADKPKGDTSTDINRYMIDVKAAGSP